MNDLDALFADLSVDVRVGAKTIKGIFDSPDDLVGGGVVLSTEYMIMVKSTDIPGMDSGDSVSIGAANYEVRQVRKLDDGALSRVLLSLV